ncbi:hypothetical protein C8Q74DRAFT_1311375 [Fomes fomentarius]|nr:hypothetical protein C8Q74DRAFT_1311375 [Fomes fomentarius]
MKDDGNFILNKEAKDTLDVNHPINDIHLHIGPTLTYIAIEYQLANGSTTKLVHGAKLTSDDVVIVKLKANESLVKVYGRISAQTDGEGARVTQIGFTTEDNETKITREHGPFGSSGTHEFSYSNSGGFLAFGGFVTKSHNAALSGLFFLSK